MSQPCSTCGTSSASLSVTAVSPYSIRTEHFYGNAEAHSPFSLVSFRNLSSFCSFFPLNFIFHTGCLRFQKSYSFRPCLPEKKTAEIHRLSHYLLAITFRIKEASFHPPEVLTKSVCREHWVVALTE